MPITYPTYNHHLSSYDYKWSEITHGNTIDGQFEFGHGLSYTTFAYSNLQLPCTLEWNDQLTMQLTVRNSGTRQGDHTILLYVSDLYRTVAPPNEELKTYTKVSLEPKQQSQVQFTLNRTDLSFIGFDLIRQTEPGAFNVTVGNIHATFTLRPRNQSSKSNSQQHVIF